MSADGLGVSGPVSVGLAPGTAAATLAVPLIRTVRTRHPGIILYLNENYGTALSELIMNGRMDVAVLYGNRAVHGLSFLPLLDEELFLVGPPSPTTRLARSPWLRWRTRSCSCRAPTTSCASWWTSTSCGPA